MPCNNRTFTLWRLHVHFLLINVANRWSNLNGEKKNYALLMCYWCLCQHIFFSSTDARVKQTTDKVGTAAPYQCPNFCSKASWLGGGGERHSFFHLTCYLLRCQTGYGFRGLKSQTGLQFYRHSVSILNSVSFRNGYIEEGMNLGDSCSEQSKGISGLSSSRWRDSMPK